MHKMRVHVYRGISCMPMDILGLGACHLYVKKNLNNNNFKILMIFIYITLKNILYVRKSEILIF